MRSKIYKKLILLFASVLLVAAVISAATLGWFNNNKTASVENITLSIDSITELEITSDKINFVVPSGYNNGGIAPGCLGYFTLSIKNPNESTPAAFSISVDLNNGSGHSSIPTNLHVYKGNFVPNNPSVSNQQNTYWPSGSYVSGTGVKTIIQGSALADATVNYTIAFFWPYSSNSNNANDTLFGRGKDFSLKVLVAA